MYGFLAYCQDTLHSSPDTRTRKIVSIRQFWKCLKTKVHLIHDNITEELKTPKRPKRIVRCLTLEESVRLLIETGSSPVRDNCIITIFLNCALRLSELAALNIDQVNSDILSVIGKGNKERKIYMTPAAKQALSQGLSLRTTKNVSTDALFISRNGGRPFFARNSKCGEKTYCGCRSILKASPPTNCVILLLYLCTNMVM